MLKAAKFMAMTIMVLHLLLWAMGWSILTLRLVETYPNPAYTGLALLFFLFGIVLTFISAHYLGRYLVTW